MNKNRKYKSISIGDCVYIKKVTKCGKLGARYMGPSHVQGVLGSIVFCNDLATGKS